MGMKRKTDIENRITKNQNSIVFTLKDLSCTLYTFRYSNSLVFDREPVEFVEGH